MISIYFVIDSHQISCDTNSNIGGSFTNKDRKQNSLTSQTVSISFHFQSVSMITWSIFLALSNVTTLSHIGIPYKQPTCKGKCSGNSVCSFCQFCIHPCIFKTRYESFCFEILLHDQFPRHSEASLRPSVSLASYRPFSVIPSPAFFSWYQVPFVI